MKLPFFNKDKQRSRILEPHDYDNLNWFWHRYLKQKAPWLVVVLVMIFLQGLVYQQFLSLTESGLRIIFDDGDMRALLTTCATVFGVFVFRGIMSYLVPRFSAWIAEDAILKLRTDLVKKLMTYDLAFFEKTPAGIFILKLAQQSERLSLFVGQSTVKGVRDLATIVILSVYLFYKQPLLFTSAAVILPFIFLTMKIVSDKVKSISAAAEGAMGTYIDGIEEMSNGMRTVKIAGQEEVEEQRLVTASHMIKDVGIKMASARALVLPYIDLAAAVVYTLVIGGGGYMVLSPDYDIDGAGIITFLIGLVLIFDPGRRLAQFFVTIQMGLFVLGSIRELFEAKPKIFDKEGATDTFDPYRDIVFENVDFTYQKSIKLFKDLDLQFEGGKTTAIVGPTGSGKTTILSLMARLYDVQNGEITIGGTPIKDIKIKSLRSAFSVVAQDIVIFNNSLIENIRYVRPDATDEEVWAAAESAEIAELMRERGDKEVGPKGSLLSGGQKQRIAIARAFLKNAPIVLLDEATSALDQKTEEKVKVALARLSKNKTTVVVAHRLSSVNDADRIYVLESGAIAESGTHSELMESGGLYAQLYESQRKSYGD
ncbi:MAG: ABC transporter ATP-binding protein [Pseudomonadota bacterium]